MRFAVIGNRGMFGTEVALALEREGSEMLGFNRSNLDLEMSIDELARQLEKADVVVNCVAYTAVDRAESEPELANLVNGVYAGKLAQASALFGARFMHISTDYVFDGMASDPYLVTDAIDPHSVYGSSKALGEKLVAESGADYSIFRTSWLYGEHGRCFPKVIAGLLNERDSISVVNDQIGQATWTRDLADVVINHAINGRSERLVNAVASGKGSWFDFANEIKSAVAGFEKKEVRGISTADYPTPAKRPAWSVLENKQTQGLVIGDWRERWREAAPLVLKDFI